MTDLLKISRIISVLCLFDIVRSKDAVQTWALLAAGSNEWYNYRHQADICHAYQILRSHGVPKENIIVMMYDDIAHNSQNPRPGVIINHPNGHDVYKNVTVDYRGEDVTPENFIKVLTGDAKAMKGIGSGRVMNSTKNDRVFVNFVDHGGQGVLSFPSGELTVGEFTNALKKVHKQNMYDDMVIYVEACHSGSMFKNVLPKNMKIYSTTAANESESSYACYYDSVMENYLGDLYSVNWMEDTEKRDIAKETLIEQYSTVKKETNESHVMEFGDLNIARLPVADFQGEELGLKFNYPKVKKSAVASIDVPLMILNKKMSKSNDIRLFKEYKNLLKKRKYLEKTVKTILRRVAENETKSQEWFTTMSENINDLECHTKLVHEFSRKCFNFGKSSYVLKFTNALVNMCNDNVSIPKVLSAFDELCREDNFQDRDTII